MVKVLTEDPPVKGLSQGQQVVAKLYDPMYMNDDGFYINPFLVADKEYTNETAAYQALSDFQGSKSLGTMGLILLISLFLGHWKTSAVSDSL